MTPCAGAVHAVSFMLQIRISSGSVEFCYVFREEWPQEKPKSTSLSLEEKSNVPAGVAE